MKRWIATPGGRLLAGIGLAATLLLAVDLARPPAAQRSTRALLAVIDLYQATLSGRTGVRCRFEPTCSIYGEAVIRRRGALVGGAKAAWRILRCGPWTAAGTEDPPPEPAQPEPQAGESSGMRTPRSCSGSWSKELALPATRRWRRIWSATWPATAPARAAIPGCWGWVADSWRNRQYNRPP